MKIITKIFFIVFLLTSGSEAVSQPVTWQRIYGLNDNRDGTCGIQTFDGGYLFLSANPYTKVIKINIYGIIEWQKVYYVGAQFKVIQTSDSGYAMCGTGGKLLPGGILKIKNNGDSVWYREYGTTSEFRLQSIVQFYDKGFICCGYKNQYVYALRVDSSGNLIWGNQIIDNYAKNYFGQDLICDNNFNIAITGFSMNVMSVPERRDVLLYKLNPDGNVYLKKYFSTEPVYETGARIIGTYDDNYIISGSARNYSMNPVYNSQVTKLDTNGNLIYQKYYIDETYYIAKSADSNSYVLTGTQYMSEIGFPKYCFKKIDLSGNEIWTRTLNNAAFFSLPEDIKLVIDGGYLCTGFFYDTTLQRYSSYVVKTDSSCYAIDPVNIFNFNEQMPTDFKLFPSYPNPFNPYTNIKFEIEKSSFYKLELFDIRGRSVDVVFNKYLSSGLYLIKLEKEFRNLPSSVYFLNLSSENNSKIQKLVLLK